MFDQTLAPRPRNKRSLSTVTLSVLLHAAALAVVLALQFTSSIEGLIVASPLPAFVAQRVIPPPVVTPPPAVRQRAATAPLPNPEAAPVEAADGFTPEPDSVPRFSGPPVPGAIPIGPPNDYRGLTHGRGIDQLVAPPPSRQGPVRIGGDILAPTRVVYVPPVYPTIAVTARIEGEVALEATIDEAGAVQNVVVRQSVPLLDRAAIEAVSKWRYSPTRLNGQPVAVIMLVRVKFTLK